MGSGAIQYQGRTATFNYAIGHMHPPAPFFMEDMLFDVLADTPYVTVTQAGTPTGAAAVSTSAGDPVAGHGGWLAGASDDVDAEIDEVAITGSPSAGSAWRADQVGPGILAVEWGISVPTALTARQYFAGITDDPTEGTATQGPVMNTTTTTVAATADDAAGWVLGSASTSPTIWKGVSVDSTVVSGIVTGRAGGANTWIGLRTEIDVNGDCYFSIRSKRGGSLEVYGKSTVGLSPDVLLVPIFTAAPTTTTAVPWEIDYGFVAASHAV